MTGKDDRTMNLYARYHCGLDAAGRRHWRMKPLSAARHCAKRDALSPRIAWVLPCRAGQEVWRNGFHRRRWQTLCALVRADRRCFLTTLTLPPLVPPHKPF